MQIVTIVIWPTCLAMCLITSIAFCVNVCCRKDKIKKKSQIKNETFIVEWRKSRFYLFVHVDIHFQSKTFAFYLISK